MSAVAASGDAISYQLSAISNSDGPALRAGLYAIWWRIGRSGASRGCSKGFPVRPGSWRWEARREEERSALFCVLRVIRGALFTNNAIALPPYRAR